MFSAGTERDKSGTPEAESGAFRVGAMPEASQNLERIKGITAA